MKAMTRIICVLVGGIVLAAVGMARAQGYGLQVAESAERRDQGYMDVTVGYTLSDDVQSFAVRETYAAAEWLRLFIDLGLVKPDAGDNDLAAQAGGMLCLPVEDLPVDLGLRGAVYVMRGDVQHVYGGNLLLLGSKEAIFEGLYLYVGAGINYQRTTTEGSAIASPGGTPVIVTERHADNDVSPMATAGALMPITENLSFYAEVTAVEHPFIGIGLRYR